MLPGVKRSDREGSIKSFNAWIKRVKSTVPPEKLLIYDVKEGWEPLCSLALSVRFWMLLVRLCLSFFVFACCAGSGLSLAWSKLAASLCMCVCICTIPMHFPEANSWTNPFRMRSSHTSTTRTDGLKFKDSEQTEKSENWGTGPFYFRTSGRLPGTNEERTK